jgi:hypothetical protein
MSVQLSRAMQTDCRLFFMGRVFIHWRGALKTVVLVVVGELLFFECVYAMQGQHIYNQRKEKKLRDFLT